MLSTRPLSCAQTTPPKAPEAPKAATPSIISKVTEAGKSLVQGAYNGAATCAKKIGAAVVSTPKAHPKTTAAAATALLAAATLKYCPPVRNYFFPASK